MEYNVNMMRKETVILIGQINTQIAELDARAREMDIPTCKLTDHEGQYMLAPLLQAKATAYNTLVMLQSGGNASARRRSSGG